MQNSTKFISYGLFLAALACFVGGGIALSNTLSDKAYWEDKGTKSDADLSTLENGLATLQANEKAYFDGRITYTNGLEAYNTGQQELADGEQAYAAGVVTLNTKQQEYDTGVAELQAAATELAAGKRTLDANYQAYIDGKAQIAEYEEGQRNYEQGLADYNTGQDNVKNGTAELIAKTSENAGFDLGTLEAAEQYVQANTALLEKVKPIVDQIKTIQTDYYVWLADYNQINAFLDKTSSKEPLNNTSKSTNEYKEAINDNADEPQKTELQNKLSSLTSRKTNIGASTFQSLMGGLPYREYVEKELTKEGFDDSKAIVDNVSNISINPWTKDNFTQFIADMETISVVSNATVNLYENGQRDITDFNAGMAKLNTGKAELAAAEPQLAAAKQTLDANYPAYIAGKAKIAEYEEGQAEYNAGLAAYQAGQAELAAGATQLAAGRAELDTASTTLAEGKQSLASAKKQLTDGEAQLAEFETGRDQAIAGIDTVLATETYGDLTSIADRLGPDYRYTDNDGNLDIAQGFAAVNTARAYSADNTAAVTRDLTARTIAAIAVLVAGAFALISSFIFYRRAKK